jgi:hypothetical protein
MNNTSFWYPLWKSKHGRTFAHATNEISTTRWSLIRLGLWCLTPLSTIFSLHRGGRIYGSRKPPTHRQSLTNFSVTNNLIHNIAMIPDIVLKFLTFDTDGQHSTWRYDKKNDCNLPIRVITKLPNSEQSYKGKVKTHKYINRKNQSTTLIGKLQSFFLS